MTTEFYRMLNNVSGLSSEKLHPETSKLYLFFMRACEANGLPTSTLTSPDATLPWRDWTKPYTAEKCIIPEETLYNLAEDPMLLKSILSWEVPQEQSWGKSPRRLSFHGKQAIVTALDKLYPAKPIS